MEDIIKIIVFQIGEQSFGMEISQLAGILSDGESADVSITEYPDGKKTMYIDDNVIPVLDLHKRLRPSPRTPIKSMLLVFSSAGTMLAVPIDRAETIYNVPYRNLYPVPLVVRNRENHIIERIAVLKERLIPLFTSERLFALIGESI